MSARHPPVGPEWLIEIKHDGFRVIAIWSSWTAMISGETPLVTRKATLERLLARGASGLRFNEHLDQEDGPLVFLHACKLGLEGIVS
jgi:ATP-dependent DNA ligase